MASGERPSAETIAEKLRAAFRPERLDVVDESDRHRGHAGWREGGRTHFRVTMRAAAFDGMSRIDRARAVHAALREEIEGGVHALALDLSGAGARQ
jgi:BolA protein